MENLQLVKTGSRTELSEKSIPELAGTLLGFPLGIVTGSLSFLRRARMFHPSGTVVGAKVISLQSVISFHPRAIVRLSGALWKNKKWKDTLGIAVRFTDKIQSEASHTNDQDLLFASFKHAWQTPLSPFLTHSKDFFQNQYFTIAPFRVKNKIVFFRLTPLPHGAANGSREEILLKNIEKGSGLRLWMKEEHGPWKELADLVFQQQLNWNQEKMKFNPFLDGLNFRPVGFLHHLRIGSYLYSQLGRGIWHGF